MIKTLFILAGTLSLIVGITGIFIPGLPTTPFVLLTAGLYVRSSPRLYNKLVNHRLTGRYFTGEVSLWTRIFSIIIMWSMILLTSFLIIKNIEIKVLLISLGIIGTLFKIRFRLPGKKKEPEQNETELSKPRENR